MRHNDSRYSSTTGMLVCTNVSNLPISSRAVRVCAGQSSRAMRESTNRVLCGSNFVCHAQKQSIAYAWINNCVYAWVTHRVHAWVVRSSPHHTATHKLGNEVRCRFVWLCIFVNFLLFSLYGVLICFPHHYMQTFFEWILCCRQSALRSPRAS